MAQKIFLNLTCNAQMQFKPALFDQKLSKGMMKFHQKGGFVWS